MPIRELVNEKRTRAWNYMFEDPDPNNRRIYINNQAHNIDNLNVIPGDYFYGQGTDMVAAPDTQHPVDWGYTVLQTMGRWCLQYSTARQETHVYPGHSDPWMASLDYYNIPGQQSLKTSTGLNVIMSFSSYSTNDGLMSYWAGYDFNKAPVFYSASNGAFCTVFYEDPYGINDFYAISYDNGTYYLGKLRFTGAGVAFTSARSTANNLFFVGTFADGSALFADVHGNTQSIEFYKIGTLATSSLVNTFVHPGPSTHHYQFPSNIRHDSASRKVFYQGGWDQNILEDNKQAIFHRFVWNPVSGEITSTRCTLVYPTGTNHLDYQRLVRFEPTYHTQNKNAWWYKPHQFTVGGQTYITYMFIDRSAPNYPYERAWYYRRDKQNIWITFTVGSGTDDHILTYHSTITWDSSNRHYPRYYLPINEIGNQLLIVRMDTVCTISFDPDRGWFEHDVEFISARSIAQDTTNRIYISTSGINNYYDSGAQRYDYSNARGHGMVYEYLPSQPISVRLSLDQINYVYSGINSTANLTINTKNVVSNTQVSANVKLVINGSNAKFSNNSQIITVETSANSNVVVPITITGGGRPLITSHVVI